MTDLIDRIYEAAFIPERWTSVLQETSELSASASAQIFLFSDTAPPRGVTLDNMRPLFDGFLKGDTWKFCDSVQKMCAVQPASFVRVEQFMTSEEIARDPARVILRKAGIGAHLCTAVAMPTGELATYVFQKWTKDGEYADAEIDPLNGLRPHLARAAMVSARLGLERAEATASALETMGLPAAILSPSARVLAANGGFERMRTRFLPLARGRLALADSEANRLFQAALVNIGSAPAPVSSIPLPPKDGEAAIVVHLLPLRRGAQDIFGGAVSLVLATPIAPTKLVPSASLLNALFDLSPAEARLATHLANGLTLSESAALQSVTVKTARTYLERVFRKTGARRQSQLLDLLKAVQPPWVAPG